MEKIDIALIDKGGYFDIDFEDGDIKTVDSMDTAITMTIYGERRADETEQPVNHLRRGWVGNLLNDTPDYEYGSKLWQSYQARATVDTRNKVTVDLQDAFTWFVFDGHLQNVLVTSELSGSEITPNIDLIRSQNEVDSRSFKLWQNTGVDT
jgi:phage gp46-like protein